MGRKLNAAKILNLFKQGFPIVYCLYDNKVIYNDILKKRHIAYNVNDDYTVIINKSLITIYDIKNHCFTVPVI